jgi:hypothetical protein
VAAGVGVTFLPPALRFRAARAVTAVLALLVAVADGTLALTSRVAGTASRPSATCTLPDLSTCCA